MKFTDCVDLADIAERAADAVAERGHLKGDVGWDGPICTLNALHFATTGRYIGLDKAVDSAVHPVEHEFIQEFLVGVCAWNNEPSRTQADVVDGLRGWAERLRTPAC